MATEKQNVEVVYSVKDQGAAKSAQSLGDKFNAMKGKLIAVTAAFAGITAVIAKGIKDWSDQESAVAKLNQAMKNSGTYTDGASKDLQNYATSLQKTTVYSDEAILGGQALIASFGIEGKALKDLTKSALDLATAKKMDLNSAFDLVAKTVGSSTNALGRYGIEVEGAAGSSTRAANAIAGLQKLYGGQAAAEAATFAGSMAKLKNAFGEVSESVGGAFAPTIQKVADFLMGAVTWFNNLNDSTKQAIIVFSTITAVIIALISVAGAIAAAITAIGVATSFALFGIPLIIAAIVAGFILLRGHADQIKVTFQNAFDNARIAFNNFLIAFLTGIKKITDVLNKIPGVNIDVDGAISKLEQVNAALEEKKAERLASLEDEENQKTEIETTKLQERKIALAEIELAEAENKAEMQQIMDEAKAAKEEEEGNAFREKLYARSAEELAAAGYTQDQITAIKISKDKQQKDALKKSSDAYVGYLGKAAEEEKDFGKAVAQGTLNWVKDGLKQQILAKSAELVATGSAILLATLGAAPQGWAHLAAGSALAVGGVQAVNAIQLADGGSMVVDQPTAIGGNVIAGEAGPERIDVTPLDQQSPQTIVNNIILDGEVIATQVAKINQQSRTEGTLDDQL